VYRTHLIRELEGLKKQANTFVPTPKHLLHDPLFGAFSESGKGNERGESSRNSNGTKPSFASPKPSGPVCFRCNLPGHYSKQCPSACVDVEPATTCPDMEVKQICTDSVVILSDDRIGDCSDSLNVSNVFQVKFPRTNMDAALE